jgi:hypothetical protein
MYMIKECFTELGRAVEERCSIEATDSQHLPGIMSEQIDSALLPPSDLLGTVIAAFTATTAYDRENPGPLFSHPKFIVYTSKTLTLEVVFCLPETAEHMQALRAADAFTVLVGSGLHVEYHYDPQATITDGVFMGSENVHTVEVLSKRDTRAIPRAHGTISSFCAFARPTVLLLTHLHPHRRHIDYRLYRPGILARFVPREPLIRLAAAVEALAASDRVTDASDLLVSLAGNCLFSAWELITVSPILPDKRLENSLLLRLAGANADLFHAALTFCKARDYRAKVSSLMRCTYDEALVCFLTILSELSDPMVILELINRHFPNATPRDRVASFICDLVRCGAIDVGLPPTHFAWLDILVGKQPTTDTGSQFATEPRALPEPWVLEQVSATLADHWLIGGIVKNLWPVGVGGPEPPNSRSTI